MTHNELVAEIRAAAASLLTAAGAAESGDMAAAEVGIEDALFRVQSLMGRVQQAVEAGQSPPAAGYGIDKPKADRRDRG